MFQKEKDQLKKGPEKQNAQQIYNKLKNELAEEQQTFNDMFAMLKDSLDYLSNVLPTETFILTENFIVPLKTEFLRENGDLLAFKYGSAGSSLKINVLGKVTNIIDDVDAPNFDRDAFFKFPLLINNILGELEIIKKGDKIVSPIAIYFEVN